MKQEILDTPLDLAVFAAVNSWKAIDSSALAQCLENRLYTKNKRVYKSSFKSSQ